MSNYAKTKKISQSRFQFKYPSIVYMSEVKSTRSFDLPNIQNKISVRIVAKSFIKVLQPDDKVK